MTDNKLKKSYFLDNNLKYLRKIGKRVKGKRSSREQIIDLIRICYLKSKKDKTEEIAATVHNDNSSRVQTVSKENNQNLISLSDRFGCWVGFYDSSQEKYINIVKYYLKKNSIRFSKHLERKALNWSIEKGNFSGRTAQQFVKNLK